MTRARATRRQLERPAPPRGLNCSLRLGTYQIKRPAHPVDPMGFKCDRLERRARLHQPGLPTRARLSTTFLFSPRRSLLLNDRGFTMTSPRPKSSHVRLKIPASPRRTARTSPTQRSTRVAEGNNAKASQNNEMGSACQRALSLTESRFQAHCLCDCWRL